jgi:hypothetical protein
MDREARAKASWQHSPIYAASHDAQSRWRGVHFGDRARGAKIGPSEEGVRVDVSTVEALWALGALEPKKRLKRPDVRVGLWWKGCRRQLPKASFSAAFSQIQRLMRLILGMSPTNGNPFRMYDAEIDIREERDRNILCGLLQCFRLKTQTSPVYSPISYSSMTCCVSVTCLSDCCLSIRLVYLSAAVWPSGLSPGCPSVRLACHPAVRLSVLLPLSVVYLSYCPACCLVILLSYYLAVCLSVCCCRLSVCLPAVVCLLSRTLVG